MIICVCNCLRERDCSLAAERPATRGPGCVYRQLGVRVQCGRCVPTMRRIVDEARARRGEPVLVEDEETYS